MKKFILSIFMCLMLMSISAFSQVDTTWHSSYTHIIIKPGDPECKLTILYNWRYNSEGIIEIFIGHRYLTYDINSGTDCFDYYLSRIHMFNDIAMEYILFQNPEFGNPELPDCKENKPASIIRVFSSACNTEETILEGKTFQYHYRACNTKGNCSALYEYCFKWDIEQLQHVVYYKRTIEKESTADCPETVKDANGIPRQCHPVHCFPFKSLWGEQIKVPNKDDIIKFTDKEYYEMVR